MLVALHVENFALIQTLDLNLSEGLVVLTGETGAGKSIIVDAINAVLGERVGSEMVRQGSDKAVVQAAFDISSRDHLARELENLGLQPEQTLVVTREVTAQGRTQCRINGYLSNLSTLRDLTQLLVDVHGQHEHQLLLANRWQLRFLDSFAGQPLQEVKQEYVRAWWSLQEVTEELNRLSTDMREKARLQDLYSFQINEIEAAGLREGEEEELREEASRLANVEKLANASRLALQYLSAGENSDGAVVAVGQAIKSLESVAQYDREIAGHLEGLNGALVLIDETCAGLRQWGETLEVSPQRIDEVQERLELISTLKRKYGETIAEVLTYLDKTCAELQTLETSDERRAELAEHQERLQEQVRDLGTKLTALRRQAVTELAGQVERELHDLGMGSARFDVDVQPVQPGPTGWDRVEFLFSANAGEALQPLSRVASGGETSRTMLALKTVLTSADPVETLVFDEVDAGIGGRTANVVGEKLKAISMGRQVLCVTHLPQIARYADQHLFVDKQEDRAAGEQIRTTIQVTLLDSVGRVDELARMLGGDGNSEAAVQHARELLGVSAS